jgi:carbonic anhydrase
VARIAGLCLGIVLMFGGVGVALADQGVPWSYSGDTGPASWGSLSPDYALCGDGREQSPVDVPAAAPANSAGLSFDYKASPLDIENNGHTIEAVYAPGSSITLDGARYELEQLHFHHQSEHAVNGQRDPMELHLVHKDAAGTITVVAVLLKEGAENPAFAPVFQNIPAQPGPAAEVPGASVDAAALLPADRTYWRYDGSLTTPPCSQGVNWVIMTQPVEVSTAQINAFAAVYPDNFRPLQPLNGRTFLGVPVALPATGGAELAPGVLTAVGCLMLVAGLTLVVTLRRRPLS